MKHLKNLLPLWALLLHFTITTIGAAQDALYVVSVNPGQSLSFEFDAPVPLTNVVQNDKFSYRIPAWSVTGGDITSLSEQRLTYDAPIEQGLYLVLWQYEQEQVAIWLRVRGAETDPLCDMEVAPVQYGGRARVPLNGPAPFNIYFAGQGPPIGVTVCMVANRPITGKKPKSPCTGAQNVSKSKVYHKTYTNTLGSVTVTSELSARLADIGIRVAVGVTVNIIQKVERTTTVVLTDCYRCVNGRTQLAGSRVEYTICDKITYNTPDWACEAASILMVPPCKTYPRYVCEWIGDCGCYYPVLTGCK